MQSDQFEPHTYGFFWARQMMWSRVSDGVSVEIADISERASENTIKSLVLMAEREAPLRLSYYLHCNEGWQPSFIGISQEYLGERRHLSLAPDLSGGGWRMDSEDAPDLAGCTDLDIEASPLPSALSILRGQLPIGQSRNARVASVRVPSLEVIPRDRTYERLTKTQYRCRDLADGVDALIDVDRHGWFINYGEVWHRVAEGEPPPELRDATA